MWLRFSSSWKRLIQKTENWFFTHAPSGSDFAKSECLHGHCRHHTVMRLQEHPQIGLITFLPNKSSPCGSKEFKLLNDALLHQRRAFLIVTPIVQSSCTNYEFQLRNSTNEPRLNQRKKWTLLKNKNLIFNIQKLLLISVWYKSHREKDADTKMFLISSLPISFLCSFASTKRTIRWTNFVPFAV